LRIDLAKCRGEYLNESTVSQWTITLVNTGLKSMTDASLKRLAGCFNNNEDILITYGDAVSAINLRELIGYHNSHYGSITVTAVRSLARFGELILDEDLEQ